MGQPSTLDNDLFSKKGLENFCKQPHFSKLFLVRQFAKARDFKNVGFYDYSLTDNHQIMVIRKEEKGATPCCLFILTGNKSREIASMIKNTFSDFITEGDDAIEILTPCSEKGVRKIDRLEQAESDLPVMIKMDPLLMHCPSYTDHKGSFGHRAAEIVAAALEYRSQMPNSLMI